MSLYHRQTHVVSHSRDESLGGVSTSSSIDIADADEHSKAHFMAVPTINDLLESRDVPADIELDDEDEPDFSPLSDLSDVDIDAEEKTPERSGTESAATASSLVLDKSALAVYPQLGSDNGILRNAIDDDLYPAGARSGVYSPPPSSNGSGGIDGGASDDGGHRTPTQASTLSSHPSSSSLEGVYRSGTHGLPVGLGHPTYLSVRVPAYNDRRFEYNHSYGPVVPSLSPMSISMDGTMSSSSSQKRSPDERSPITPISPFFQSTSSDIIALSPGDPPSSGAFLAPDEYRRESPYRTRHASHSAVSFNSDEQTRQRLKRPHFAIYGPSEESAYALARAQAQRNASFIGPQTELDAAASAAALAAAKTGAGAGAFVYKVYHMLLDPKSADLISFSESGKSFIVHNTVAFARDVLPNHFKHNNFSSFVRQLNMYGFHKVNKTPRGQAKHAESQAWEFNHPKFVRGRPQQLDEIKRKPSDSDSAPTLVPSTSRPPRISSTGGESPDTTDPEFSPTSLIIPENAVATASVPLLRSASSVSGTSGPHRPTPLPIVPVTAPPSQTLPPSQQPYPSPQSHHSPQHFSHPVHLHYNTPTIYPNPAPRAHSHEGRVGVSTQQLEHPTRHRAESTSVQSTTHQDYEKLAKDYEELLRRQEPLLALVKDLYQVLRQTGGLSLLPYPFPMQYLSSPSASSQGSPRIAITPAHRTQVQANDSLAFDMPTSVQSVPDQYQVRTPHGEVVSHDSRQAARYPRDTMMRSASSSQVDSGMIFSPVDSLMFDPSAARVQTLTLSLASPLSATFSRAISTPLPVSPHTIAPQQHQHHQQTQAMVGLGFSDETTGRYYDGFGSQDTNDVEMAALPSSFSEVDSRTQYMYAPIRMSNSRSAGTLYSPQLSTSKRQGGRVMSGEESGNSGYYVRRENDGMDPDFSHPHQRRNTST